MLVLYIHNNVRLIKESVVLLGQDNAEGADRQTFESELDFLQQKAMLRLLRHIFKLPVSRK